jgi:broad specificity phosphatase PhoE
MTLVWLIRHGSHSLLGRELVGRKPGVFLNAAGEEEAAALATAFSTRPLAAIFSGPLERAMQTAAPMARNCKLALATEEALQEIDFGDWTGAEFTALEVDARWQHWNGHRGDATCPGGESMEEVRLRIASFIDSLESRFPFQEVALFGHGDVFRAALAHYQGIPLDRLLSIDFPPGSAALLELTGGAGRVIKVIRQNVLDQIQSIGLSKELRSLTASA